MRKIQILGPGCPKCRKLAANAEEAAQALGIEYDLEKVTAIDKIMAFGVVMTPGLVIDGEVRATGKVPSVEEIKGMF
jgi:small redox-active disulfide protein 2